MLIVVMAGALAMSPNVADPDLWGHVQFGRDVLNEGWFPESNPYSYNTDGFRWINHENISEIVMAWTVDNLGPIGLVLGKFVLSLIVLCSILYFNARNKVSLIPNCIVTLLVAWNLGYHWSFRPQVSSFVCFTAMALLLNMSFIQWREKWHLPIPGVKWFSRGTEDPKSKWLAEDLKYSNFHGRFLWFAPLLFFVWANLHGGFVAGLCIFCRVSWMPHDRSVRSPWHQWHWTCLPNGIDARGCCFGNNDQPLFISFAWLVVRIAWTTTTGNLGLVKRPTIQHDRP